MTDQPSEAVEAEVVETTEAVVEETTQPEQSAEDYVRDLFNNARSNMPEEMRDHRIEAEEQRLRVERGERNAPEKEISELPDTVEGEVESTSEDETASEDDDITYFSFKSGEETIQVPEDATIEIKVDGELVEVPIAEIKSGISGQKAIAQRFSALDAEKKELERQNAMWAEGRQRVSELAQNGQVVEAIDFLLDQAGMNSEEFTMRFFEQVSGPLEKYMSMTPEEQTLWEEQVRAQRHQLQYEQVKAENERLHAEKQQLAAVQRVQTQFGLDDVQFADLYHQLSNEMAEGRLPSQPITADLVGQYHVLLGRETMIRGALSQVNDAFASDDAIVAGILNKVNAMSRGGQEVTEQDVLNLVTETYGLEAKVSKAKQVQQSLEKKGNSSALGTEVSRIAESKSHRDNSGGHWNFLSSLNKELSSATSMEERRKIIDKHRNRNK